MKNLDAIHHNTLPHHSVESCIPQINKQLVEESDVSHNRNLE